MHFVPADCQGGGRPVQRHNYTPALRVGNKNVRLIARWNPLDGTRYLTALGLSR